MSKVKKWKFKYSSLNKRKRELAELNNEKDKIIPVKDKIVMIYHKLSNDMRQPSKKKLLKLNP